jgi:diacylglycerol kinase family enzyme
VLAETSTALGVLPSGTANVWAKEQGLQRLDWAHWFALENAANRLSRGTYRYADIGECNEEEFLLWAGIGLDAEIVNTIEPRERWEKALATLHYATWALWSSIGWEGITLRVRAPDIEIEGNFLVAVASNIRAYAGGLLELAPNAKIDDGKLDFWLIGGRSVTDAVIRLLQIWRGTHVSAPGVINFQADEAVFESDEDFHMQFDGEPKLMRTPARFRVRQKALRVLVPANSGPLFSAERKTHP